MSKFRPSKLTLPSRINIDTELNKELDETLDISLIKLYNFNLDIPKLDILILPIIGEGSDKIAYLYQDKVIYRTKSHTYNIGKEVNTHINLIREYILYQGKYNNELQFIIPKIYYSKENSSNYIVDYITCKNKTHSKDFSKLTEEDHIFAYGQFIYFCLIILKLYPLDVEYCIDTNTNKLIFMDFGNFRTNLPSLDIFTKDFTEENKIIFQAGYNLKYKNKYLKYKNKYLTLKGGAVISPPDPNNKFSEKPTCSICLEFYNDNNKRPLLLHGSTSTTDLYSSTNHYICVECFNSPGWVWKKCPSCQKVLGDTFYVFRYNTEKGLLIPLFDTIYNTPDIPDEYLSKDIQYVHHSYPLGAIQANPFKTYVLTITIKDKLDDLKINSFIHDSRWKFITKIYLKKIGVTSLPELPPYLDALICTNNKLTSLPVLPKSLKYLYCNYNQLSTLPELPKSLKYLYCNNNELSILPKLHHTLEILVCNNNNLTQLPPLPQGLLKLNCNYNNLQLLPGYIYFGLQRRLLNSEPLDTDYKSDTLPPSLLELSCANNLLVTLPNLTNIQLLNCSYNRLDKLPELPDSLEELYCQVNAIGVLPKLPMLRKLNCSHNHLSKLPELFDKKLISINISYNFLEDKPIIQNPVTEMLSIQNDKQNKVPLLDWNNDPSRDLPNLTGVWICDDPVLFLNAYWDPIFQGWAHGSGRPTIKLKPNYNRRQYF